MKKRVINLIFSFLFFIAPLFTLADSIYTSIPTIEVRTKAIGADEAALAKAMAQCETESRHVLGLLKTPGLNFIIFSAGECRPLSDHGISNNESYASRMIVFIK